MQIVNCFYKLHKSEVLMDPIFQFTTGSFLKLIPYTLSVQGA
jgi:hypothetical protein